MKINKDIPILNRREEEWNEESIKYYLENLFSNIELLDNWKFKSVEWKNPRNTGKEELKYDSFTNISVNLSQNDEDVTYTFKIPNLIERQFFFIGGHYKVPIFQLTDDPIIYKPLEKENKTPYVKLKTNLLSLNLSLKKEKETYFVKVMKNRKIPFEFLIAGYHPREEFEEFMKDKLDNEVLKTLYDNTIHIYEKYSEKKIFENIGKYILKDVMKGDNYKRGNSILFYIKSGYDIDFFSKKFFKTNSPIFEMLNAIHEGPRSDTDLNNKRVRFAEYVFYDLIKKVHEMINTFKFKKKIKFNISKSIVLDSCNVSDIVHFSFCMNPVSELSSLLQIVLTGPGNFKKQNVPTHLRNIDDSQFGKICPTDTPDRESCGVVLNLVPNVLLDENGKFLHQDKTVTSYPINLTPFLKNDDQTRLQMASSQSKQTILIGNSEPSMVRTGFEEKYIENTTFMKRAKKDGKTIYVDKRFILVQYIDETFDIFSIGMRNLFLSNVDVLYPRVNEGEEFKQDDILYESKFIKDGKLSLGQDLLTGVCIWKGYNYEDAIIISESTAKEKFTSLHYVDLSFEIDSGDILLSLEDDKYKPLPNIGDRLKKGDVYSKLKNISGEEGYENINVEPKELRTPVDCTIQSIEIYPNQWNKKIIEFNQFINSLMSKQSNMYHNIKHKLQHYLKEPEIQKFLKVNNISPLDCFKQQGKYKIKNKEIGGVHIKIRGVYRESMRIGDKVANRHGNKGIISRIIPDDKMPKLKDGRTLDIIINPLGIISRMNIGQLYELHSSECIYRLRKIMYSKQNEDKCKQVYKEFLNIVYKDGEFKDSKYDKFCDDIKNIGLEKAIDKIYLECEPFNDMGLKELKELMSYTKSKFEQKLYDPETESYLNNSISYGYMNFLKLYHRSEEKMSARSIGSYSKTTLQPLGGRQKGSAHKFGEMEVWALQGHGAKEFLNELMTTHSDSPRKKSELLSDIINNKNLVDESEDNQTQSTLLFESFLKTMGIKFVRDD